MIQYDFAVKAVGYLMDEICSDDSHASAHTTFISAKNASSISSVRSFWFLIMTEVFNYSSRLTAEALLFWAGSHPLGECI